MGKIGTAPGGTVRVTGLEQYNVRRGATVEVRRGSRTAARVTGRYDKHFVCYAFGTSNISAFRSSPAEPVLSCPGGVWQEGQLYQTMYHGEEHGDKVYTFTRDALVDVVVSTERSISGTAGITEAKKLYAGLSVRAGQTIVLTAKKGGTGWQRSGGIFVTEIEG